MTGRVLMIQGVASSVGKSLITAALCRAYARRGLMVAPFKAQNMSNNAAVTSEGGEIGRAQALQARAAGIEPHVDMNPILLKPEHDGGSQVIVLGRATERLRARDYFERRERLWPVVQSALDSIRQRYDLVFIEGAGSPAEVNLRKWDIVNMRVARYADAPVLLVADIDRGGALASLVGTLELLEPADRALVSGLMINRFRGDASLLEPALQFLRQRTGTPVVGVLPYVSDLRLPAEDSAQLGPVNGSVGAYDVAAIRLPALSNFDDLDPLAAASCTVRWISDARSLGSPSLIVIPGSKSTRADVDYLWRSGLGAAIRAAAARGAVVLGICGGYQILGTELIDPLGLEGPAGTTPGLGLLPVRTTFQAEKVTRKVEGKVVAAAGPLARARGAKVTGYEIHDGVTEHSATPVLAIAQPGADYADGAHDKSGRVIGTYLHGLLHNHQVIQAITSYLGHHHLSQSYEDVIESELDRLADLVETHADISAIDNMVGL